MVHPRDIYLETITIKRAAGRAGHKWQKIKNHIIAEVTSGDYAAGDAIPSENYICDQTGVSRTTVRQAFRELETEGVIYRVKGKGTFLSDIKTSEPAKKQQCRLYGLVIPEIREPLYASLTQGFGDYLSCDNFQTLVCDSGDDIARQGNIFLQLLHRSIDGIAMVPSTTGKTPAFQIELLINNNIPVVLCHRGVEGVSVPVMTWDRETVGRLAGEKLISSGHKKIAYFGAYQYEVPLAHIKGLREVLSQAAIELEAGRILFGQAGETDHCFTQRERLITQMLSDKNRPTAIVCNNETEAERVFWVAYKMGIQIPRDLSLIGFGESHRNTIFKKMLTSVVLDELKLGSTAAKTLQEINLGKRPINDGTVFSLDLKLYEGGTVATI